MQYADNEYKWIVVVNRRATLAQQLNALGHVCLGMQFTCQDGCRAFHQYFAPDGSMYAYISHYPVVVLEGNDSQLKSLRSLAAHDGIACQTFLDTMLGTTAEEQLRRSRETPLLETQFIAVALFGDARELRPLTKKFSLYRGVESPHDACTRRLS